MDCAKLNASLKQLISNAMIYWAYFTGNLIEIWTQSNLSRGCLQCLWFLAKIYSFLPCRWTSRKSKLPGKLSNWIFGSEFDERRQWPQIVKIIIIIINIHWISKQNEVILSYFTYILQLSPQGRKCHFSKSLLSSWVHFKRIHLMLLKASITKYIPRHLWNIQSCNFL